MELTPTVTVFFGETSTGSDTFTLDDPVRGELDGDYVLGGDAGTDVTDHVARVSISRGKYGLIVDQYDPAVASIVFNNEDRTFDPFNADGPYFGNLRRGKKVVVSVAGVTIFTGRVADWNLEYDVGGGASAVMECEDALATLGRQEFDEWTTTGSQTAGPRLTAILNRSEVGWNGGARALDTGVSVLQSDLVSWGSNVLNYCQLVAQSDLGAFFASRDGLITFHDRHRNLGGTPEVTFADDGTGVGHFDVGVQAGSELFFTRVSVDREGGTAQTVTAASVDDDGFVSLSLSGLLQNSDSQARDMAQYLASIYSTGDPIVSRIGFHLHDADLSEAEVLDLLRLDLQSLVGVTWTPGNPPSGDPIEQTCVVIGIDHEMTPMVHDVWLHLGKFDGNQPFILDDAVTGVLDGPGVLVF